MTTTVRAVFDGEVLRPEEPVGLERDIIYIVTIEREVATLEDTGGEVYPLTEIGRLTTDMGVTDLAAHHDRYAHGHVPSESGAP